MQKPAFPSSCREGGSLWPPHRWPLSPAGGRDAMGETRALSLIPLNGGLSAPRKGRAPGVGVHPRGTGRVELGLRLYVWRAAGL